MIILNRVSRASFPPRTPISSALNFAIIRTVSAGNAAGASSRRMFAPAQPIYTTSSAIRASSSTSRITRFFFYLPRSALDGIARQGGAKRVGELAYQPGVGHDDAIVRHLGMSLLEALHRPGETNQLFIDHTMLALAAHIPKPMADCAPAVSRPAAVLRPGRLSVPAKSSTPTSAENISLQQIAAEFDLSVSHFSRAFRTSTGLPPHQWLLRQRVKVAKQLMTVRDLPLSEIAISAGFANQSHFTRVFSAAVGVSPAAWRRETQGAPESET